MNTSIYLKPDLASRINQFMQRQEGLNKNKLITIALEEYLDRYENQSGWSAEFLTWGEQGEDSEELEIDRAE